MLDLRMDNAYSPAVELAVVHLSLCGNHNVHARLAAALLMILDAVGVGCLRSVCSIIGRGHRAGGCFQYLQ